jgi:hypothetical protein
MSLSFGSSSFDNAEFVYWLLYNYQCHECPAIEFQRMFENIMKRAKPEFMQIRPYGKLGDRKADGLLLSEKTVFQVYSPDDFTQEKAIEKINDDLDGAVKEWGDNLETWTFVYNARRGLPPDIPKILVEKQKQFPQVKINSLSKEGLWEIARHLSLQQMAEVFGPPIGHKQVSNIFRSNSNLASEINSSNIEQVVLIQDVIMPVDVRSVLEALKPDIPYGAPVFVSSTSKMVFGDAAEFQRKLIEELQSNGRHLMPARYAVFSLAPIPLIAHLGFLLTDSVETRYYKFHVDSQSWKWPVEDPESVDLNIKVTGVPENIIDNACDVAIRISISAIVREHDVKEAIPGLPIQIHIFVDHPSTTWIRSLKQVELFATVFRDVLSAIREKLPFCKGIHLFFAGPAPIVLVAGQQINPRMNPPVHLYEFSKRTEPQYQYALSLR